MEVQLNRLKELAHELKKWNENTPVVIAASRENGWFSKASIMQSAERIANGYLDTEALEKWLANYDLSNSVANNRTVGIIAAGNLPMVSFHDVLCAYVLGFNVQLKCSEKDTALMTYITDFLNGDGQDASIQAVDQLSGFDIVIATGSNNSNRYFEAYFNSYPNLLRRNRTSIAVLDGQESDENLQGLADDIFDYYGLGCRNVTHLFLPKDHPVDKLMKVFETRGSELKEHSLYMNNYDYQKAILLVNQTAFFDNESVILRENESIHSPIATVHFSFYTDQEDLNEKLNSQEDELQCIVSNRSDLELKTLPFGTAQQPGLSDYADGIDTMRFLIDSGK